VRISNFIQIQQSLHFGNNHFPGIKVNFLHDVMNGGNQDLGFPFTDHINVIAAGGKNMVNGPDIFARVQINFKADKIEPEVFRLFL